MTATTRRALYAAVPLLVIAVVSLVILLRSSGSTTPASATPPASTDAAATWPAGEKRAPAIVLRDEHGRTISLASLRGRPVLVTFIDPLCQDFCPVEAQHLSDAVRAARVKPAIVAVSVNVAGNTAPTLALDRRKWHVAPQWTWGIGTRSELARVWHAYGIEVLVTRTEVVHTEASYLIDARGYERALFVWPYTAAAVAKALAATP